MYTYNILGIELYSLIKIHMHFRRLRNMPVECRAHKCNFKIVKTFTQETPRETRCEEIKFYGKRRECSVTRLDKVLCLDKVLFV